MSALPLSVVLPLGDHRGLAVDSARGWAAQTLPLGGFPVRFERFAETLLAAELDRRGYGIAHAPAAVVNHGDCVWPREIERALRALGRGRGRCLAEGVSRRGSPGSSGPASPCGGARWGPGSGSSRSD